MKVSSSAFPPNTSPPLTSKVHTLIAQHLQHSPLSQPTIRVGNINDIAQLRLLQKQWFPLDYSEDFYSKIANGQAKCFVAETSITPQFKNKAMSVIVGAVVFELAEQTDHLQDSLMNRLFSFNDRALYVMTLGVIDEMRSKGLAKVLLQKIIDFAAQCQQIGIIALHVVAYNLRAIRFYRKNGFQLLQRLEQHYHIQGKQYQGLKLGFYVNNGKRRQGWIPWLKRLFLKNQPPIWPA